MADIWSYAITFPFGATSPPYSASNPHQGQDRAAPTGTPVTVNGILIGTVGTTGLSTGPHLHVHRYVAGKAVSANGGGHTLKNAVVTLVNTTDTGANGKCVRINADEGVYLYLHLNSVKVETGQKLGEPMPTEKNIKDYFALVDKVPTATQITYYKKNGWPILARDLINLAKKQGAESNDQALKDSLFSKVKAIFGK